MSKKYRNLEIGAAIGAAVGFLAGILTAKKPGRETRQDIINTTLAKKREAEKKIKELSQELSALLETAETKLKDTSSSARESLEKAVTAARNARVKARLVLSSLHDGDASDKELRQAAEEANNAVKHLSSYLNSLNKSDKK